MKITCKIIFAVFCFVFAGGYCAFGADKDTIADSIKISIDTALPPQAKTTGTIGSNSSNSRNQWVQVEVKFRTDDVKSFNKRYLDSPELAVELATYSPREKIRNLIFTGKVNYWFLEQDGKEHYMKILLPAPFFRRYNDDRTVDRTTFVAKVSLSFNSKLYTVAYGSNKGLADKEIKGFFNRIPYDAVFLHNTLTGRAGTPWSVIEVNRYEYEKSPWLADKRIEPVTSKGSPVNFNTAVKTVNTKKAKRKKK